MTANSKWSLKPSGHSMAPPVKPKRKIGFDLKEKQVEVWKEERVKGEEESS